MHQGNDLGYGNNLEDVTMGNPQPRPTVPHGMGKVQRLDGGGSHAVWLKV